VRVFVDWVAELFERCPLLQGQKDAEERCLPTSTASPMIVRHGTPEVAGTADVVV
jgi:LysR family transcriptional regulator for bpeEF and oprC